MADRPIAPEETIAPRRSHGRYRLSIHRAWLALFVVVLGTAEAPRLRAQAEVPPLLNGVPAPADGGDANDFFWWAERTDPVRFTNSSSEHLFFTDPTAAPLTIFFPPFPPALDGEIPLFSSLLADGPPAPGSLAAYVGESFYPMLGSGLFADDLSPAVRNRIAAYHREKAGLQDELRRFLGAEREREEFQRDDRLATFAEQQAPRIADLESKAEELRDELQRRYPLVVRRGTPPAKTPLAATGPEAARSQQLQLEAEVLQLAAFYQEGLTREQRALLREAARDAGLAARHESAGPWLAFSPGTARIAVPEDAAPALRQNVADYTALKQELKDAQRAIVLDRTITPSARTGKLRQFWSREASRLAALEILAEQIRRELARRPDIDHPRAAPAIPPEIAARVAAYRRHRTEVLQKLHDALQTGKPHTAATGTVQDFNRLQEHLLGELTREMAAIRQALGAYVASGGEAQDRKSIDDLLRDFERSRQQQENSARYRDYRAAVLLPGLSPGQRRLLLDAGVEQLGLPLPPGTRIR